LSGYWMAAVMLCALLNVGWKMRLIEGGSWTGNATRDSVEP
jgi:hypothetical protein